MCVIHNLLIYHHFKNTQNLVVSQKCKKKKRFRFIKFNYEQIVYENVFIIKTTECDLKIEIFKFRRSLIFIFFDNFDHVFAGISSPLRIEISTDIFPTTITIYYNYIENIFTDYVFSGLVIWLP